MNTFENVQLKCTPWHPLFRFLNTPLPPSTRGVYPSPWRKPGYATVTSFFIVTCSNSGLSFSGVSNVSSRGGIDSIGIDSTPLLLGDKSESGSYHPDPPSSLPSYIHFHFPFSDHPTFPLFLSFPFLPQTLIWGRASCKWEHIEIAPPPKKMQFNTWFGAFWFTLISIFVNSDHNSINLLLNVKLLSRVQFKSSI